ncbi:hypothetical protein [Pseudoalteromonas sp. M8]|uniref:hypothetical protein n=1 Tax=Pseudoalteromonas sp. M8 TaxID=2692624 RepID=UPI001BACB7F8|nr:hypothetical protein [Pseudoalteromonas sp. M8]QUI70516.1 hypothetical protein GSF13_12375 [Pseudoalteromonas sp. M8]
MSAFDTQGFVDSLKERISNPFLFTFSWLFVVWNWKAFGWFMFEPLKFSLKLERFQYTGIELYFWWPLFMTFLVVIFGHSLNNFAEICKRSWDYLYASLLKKLGWKEYVDKIEHDQLQDETQKLKERNRELIHQLQNSDNEKRDYLEQISALNKSQGSSETELEHLKQEKLKLVTELTNLRASVEKSTNQTELRFENEVKRNETVHLGHLCYNNEYYAEESVITVSKNKIHEFLLELKTSAGLGPRQFISISMYREFDTTLTRPIVNFIYTQDKLNIFNQLEFSIPVEMSKYQLVIEFFEPSAISGDDIPIENKLFYIATE